MGRPCLGPVEGLAREAWMSHLGPRPLLVVAACPIHLIFFNLQTLFFRAVSGLQTNLLERTDGCSSPPGFRSVIR